MQCETGSDAEGAQRNSIDWCSRSMTPVVLKIESKIRSLIRSRIETSFRTAPRLDYEFDVEKRKSVLGSVRHCKAVRLSDLFRDYDVHLRGHPRHLLWFCVRDRQRSKPLNRFTLCLSLAAWLSRYFRTIRFRSFLAFGKTCRISPIRQTAHESDGDT